MSLSAVAETAPRVILHTPNPPHFFFALPMVIEIEILGSLRAACGKFFGLAIARCDPPENSIALIANSMIPGLRIRFDNFMVYSFVVKLSSSLGAEKDS